MKIYIYSYINKINGLRYIGKTNEVERRKREHLSIAFNPKTIEQDHDCYWYRTLRKYGPEGFDFEILEVTDNQHWAEKEQYWIEYYHTYGSGGYNETKGGEDGSHLKLLTDEQAHLIHQALIENKMTQAEIAIEWGISDTLVSNINQGLKYIDDTLNYPLRRNYKKGLEEYSELITLLRTTKKSFKQIAQELNMAESSVKKINYGKMQFDPNIDYPIRKVNSFSQDVEEIINLLKNSDMTMTQIAKCYGRNVSSVRNINAGRCHYNPNISYPIRH